MFATRVLRRAAHASHATSSFSLKESTGLFGLEVNVNPRPELIQLYNKILHKVALLPQQSVYRQSVEAIHRRRLEQVESSVTVQEIEDAVAGGQVEELIIQAKEELALVKKMEEWKPWEALESPPPVGQWESVKV
ncbi:hypothetical protein HK101_000475 [Irineochytrium annulatum]|nr:hypothetical protein HK101_000475 [Irineochytrium annulatum]